MTHGRAIHIIKNTAWLGTVNDLAEVEKAIKTLEDIESVRRGRWVEEPGMFMCSVCHDVWSTEDEEMIKGFNYCPWCGAKMEGEE